MKSNPTTRKREAGQVLIAAVTVLGIALMGFAGLGIDVGYMRYEKRLQQTAADAAAIAGANNIVPGGVVAGAKAAAATNGFTDGTKNVTITVNPGPASGPHAGDTNYVEVLVAAVQPTFFMRVLGVNSEIVTARAVATDLSGVNSSCLYLLGSAGLGISGGGTGGIQAPSCGFLDDGAFGTGNSNKWVMNVGSAATTSASDSGRGNVTCNSGQNPCPAFNIPAAANPLANLTLPTIGTAQMWANGDGPGTYSGMSLGNSHINLPSGIYVLDGPAGFSCGGNATITGTGVMFYLTNGAGWSCAGNPSVTLTAPSATNCASCSSQYYGILIYQDPTDTSTNRMAGTNTYTLNGLVVLTNLDMKGTDSLTLGGTSGYGMTAIKNTILVE
jgi:hypothetical protein